ncbi:Carcinine [Hypsibius exemplaris]|uniref:Carcinine n=1 Tax=Hypsibius exemplaris TaxID=2072580 RepID=A0A1W0X0E6_HYPEX|nr:Carcinine [Hypsibius exemplaris]
MPSIPDNAVDTTTDALLFHAKAEPSDDKNVHMGTSTQSTDPCSGVGAQFDQLLESVEQFGRYQQFVVYAVLLPAIFAYSFAQGFLLFVIATPDNFWCRSPTDYPLNLSVLNASSTLSPIQQCHELSLSSWSLNNSNSTTATLSTSEISNYPRRCQHGWDFDQSVYTSTIVTEWNLVCDSDFLPTLVYIVTTLVGTVGAPIGGYLSDRYGRKRTYFGFLALQIAAGGAAALAPSYAWFVVLASLHSLSVYPSYQTIYTLGMEILSPKHRTMFSVLVGVFYALGSVASCGLAYAVRNWRMLIVASTLPLVGLVGLFPLMPESPRFNLSKRRFGKVTHFFRRAAKWNGRNFDKDCNDKLLQLFADLSTADHKVDNRSHQPSFRDLFTNKNLRWRTCVLITLSALVAIYYGGLGFLAPKLGNNPHLNVFLTNLVDLPASLLTQLGADRLGRRLMLTVNFIFGGLFCLASVFFPPTADSSYYPVLVLFLFARMFAVSSYTVEELVSCESFPTVLRGEGISLTNGVSGVVSNLGPMIVYLSVGTQWTSPMAWFGGITILGSGLVLFLPETVDLPLPETIEDVQPFAMLRSFDEFLAPVRRRRGRSPETSVN